MFFGGLLMFGSRLGDRLGHRRTIVGSLVTFAAGAVAAVMATGVLVLAAARCLQGAAAAGAVPSALGLLTTVTSLKDVLVRWLLGVLRVLQPEPPGSSSEVW